MSISILNISAFVMFLSVGVIYFYFLINLIFILFLLLFRRRVYLICVSYLYFLFWMWKFFGLNFFPSSGAKESWLSFGLKISRPNEDRRLGRRSGIWFVLKAVIKKVKQFKSLLLFQLGLIAIMFVRSG